MLKSLLAGSALALAIPAFAQTTNSDPPVGPQQQQQQQQQQQTGTSEPGTHSGHTASPSPIGTTPADHDPTMDDADTAGTPRPITGVQVNGGVSTTRGGSTGAGTAGTVTGNPAAQGPAQDQGAMQQGGQAGTSVQAAGQMSGRMQAMGGPIDWAAIGGDDGHLTPLEFGIWYLEAQGQDIDRMVAESLRSRASNLPAVQVLNVTAAALAQADVNHDWRVSREELQAFTGQ